jgi:hypothetical protein
MTVGTLSVSPLILVLALFYTKQSCSQHVGDSAKCIENAAQYHSVNPYILRSILNIESWKNPSNVSRNTDGSIDVGAGGINSRNFSELAKWGILPNHLLDPCVTTFVTAWYLQKKIRKYGNTWEGIATYHSTTPYYNKRYQILLQNDLIKQGVIGGEIITPPPLKIPEKYK